MRSFALLLFQHPHVRRQLNVGVCIYGFAPRNALLRQVPLVVCLDAFAS